MLNREINWVNDHTQICDRLDKRVCVMEGYLNTKSDDASTAVDTKNYYSL